MSPFRKFDWIFLVLISAVLGTLTVHHYLNPDQSGHVEITAQNQLVSSNVAPDPAPIAITNMPSRDLASAKKINTQWNHFKERYGSGLQATFLANGRLVAIHGDPNQGNKASGNFRSDDPQKVIARTQEILDAAHDLIGIKATLPVKSPLFQGNEYAAQVAYREELEGIPLAPYGSVSIAVGTDGQLVSLYSDYVPEVNVPNLQAQKQNAETSRDRAIASISDSSAAVRSGGGSIVIWVGTRLPGDEGAGSAPARVARSYFVQGHEVIVDASSGEVIFKKDKRQF